MAPNIRLWQLANLLQAPLWSSGPRLAVSGQMRRFIRWAAFRANSAVMQSGGHIV
jgi:hypothetical protein